MYIKEILWLISWPVSIYVCYRIILAAIDKFEKNLEKE